MEGTSGVAEAWRYAGKRGREPTDRHDLVSRAVVGLLGGLCPDDHGVRGRDLGNVGEQVLRAERPHPD